MARVNAKITHYEEVDVNIEELLRGISHEFHINKPLFPDYGSYWKLENKDEEEVLVEYVDTSIHGSAHYEPNREITDKTSIEAYKLLNELNKIIKKKYYK